MAISYAVLGPLEVRRADDVLDLGAPRQQVVLARLLLARGRVVATDTLLDAVWGDDPPPSARNSLQVYVSHLRRLLREPDGVADPLVREAGGYALRLEPDALDLERLLAAAARAQELSAAEDWAAAEKVLREALDLVRGPLLTGLDFEAFTGDVEAVRGELTALRRQHATALLALGRAAEALPVAAALAEEEPYRDDIAHLHGLALYRAGRPAEAAAAVNAYVARLGADLGLDPGTGLRDLQTSLLRHDSWLESWPRQGGPAAVLGVDGFVGRTRELAEAHAVALRAAAGTTSWLVLTGPAGIGKTRLADEILERMVDGPVVRARCLEEAGAPAWWPVRQLLVGLGLDADALLRARGDAEADTARFEVHEGVRQALESVAGGRTVGVLADDLQWADETSLRCLVHLARSMRGARLLVVGTVRDSEARPVAQRLLADLVRTEGARQVAVPPLTEDNAAALVTAVSGEEVAADEAKALAARTGGNALFLTEYARLPREERLAGGLPLAVRGVLGRRLEAMPPDVVPVLGVAAVIGDDVDLELLARVSGLAPEALHDVLEQAADEHVLEVRRDGTGYAFSHALLREEVLARLSPVRRQRTHLQVADTLTTAGGDAITRRAQHLLAARPLGDPRTLVAACRAAAEQAEDEWFAETAVQWWSAAGDAHDALPEDQQDPGERDDLLVAQVRALARSGRGQTVLDLVSREIVDATRKGRTSAVGRLAASLLRAAGTWPWVAFDADTGELLAQLASLESFVADDVAAHARLLAALAVGSCYDADPAVPDRLSRRALELAERAEDSEVLADALLGRVMTYVGVDTHAEECETLLAQLLELPRNESGRSRRQVDAVIADSARTMSRVMLGDVAGAERYQRSGVAGADLLRLPVVRVQLRWREVGLAAWHLGPEAAMDAYATVVGAHAATELYESGFAEMALRMLRWEQRRLGEEPTYSGFEQSVWRAAEAADRGERGAADAAVAERLADPQPEIWMSLGHLVVLAHVVADLGLAHHAEPLLSRLTPHAGRLASLGQGPIVGPVDLALARLHQLLGNDAEARRLADAALGLCERNAGPRWAERCRTLSGP